MADVPLHIQWCAKDALDGMLLLSEDEELAYRRILDLIYVTGDNLYDDDRELARLTRMGRRWKKIKASLLVKKGDAENKTGLYLDFERGVITHDKCQVKLEQARRFIDQRKNAVKSREEKRKARKNKHIASTDDNTTDTSTDRTTDTSGDPSYVSSNLKPIESPKPPLEKEPLASPEGDLIFEALDALLSSIWPEAPKAVDARLLEADCHEFARMGAKPKIVADALTARLRHMAGHSRKPPGQLEPWGAELVLTRLQRMASVKRGTRDWQPDWGPEPSADELAAFEIPVDLRLASDPPAEPVDARGYPPSPEFLKRRKANA